MRRFQYFSTKNHPERKNSFLIIETQSESKNPEEKKIFIKDKELGRGLNGKVSLFVNSSHPSDKIVVKEELPESNKHFLQGKEFLREGAFSLIKYKNVAYAGDENSTAEPHYLLFDFLEGAKHLDEYAFLTAEQMLQAFITTLAELNFLHSIAISHIDIHSGNILIQDPHRVHLVDFGSCIKIREIAARDKIPDPDMKKRVITVFNFDVNQLGKVFLLTLRKNTALINDLIFSFLKMICSGMTRNKSDVRISIGTAANCFQNMIDQLSLTDATAEDVIQFFIKTTDLLENFLLYDMNSFSELLTFFPKEYQLRLLKCVDIDKLKTLKDFDIHFNFLKFAHLLLEVMSYKDTLVYLDRFKEDVNSAVYQQVITELIIVYQKNLADKLQKDYFTGVKKKKSAAMEALNSMRFFTKKEIKDFQHAHKRALKSGNFREIATRYIAHSAKLRQA